MTVGGWKSRTTVEDMDLSLRTYVNGWKAVYLSDTTCMNEVSTRSSFQSRYGTMKLAKVALHSGAPHMPSKWLISPGWLLSAGQRLYLRIAARAHIALVYLRTLQ